MGPGRWGSANIDLGVKVSYADIYNTHALIEMAVAYEDGVPSLSYGTHFYQDLVETGIYSLPLHLVDPRSRFKWDEKRFARDPGGNIRRAERESGGLRPHQQEVRHGVSATSEIAASPFGYYGLTQRLRSIHPSRGMSRPFTSSYLTFVQLARVRRLFSYIVETVLSLR